MTVFPIPAYLDNYIWALINQQSELFDCIDPGEAEPVLAFARTHQLKLRSILLTHHHHDHIGGVPFLIEKNPGCIVYGPCDDRIPNITHPVKADDTIAVGPYSFTVLFNPGHTSTHISYYERQQKYLFCGDTLFSAGCGRVFDGTMSELYQSMLLFKTLPAETRIFPAHEYTRHNLKFAQTVEPNNKNIQHIMQNLKKNPSCCSLPSTVALERSINPFLRTQIKDVIDYALKHGAVSSSSMDVFTTLRQQKDRF